MGSISILGTDLLHDPVIVGRDPGVHTWVEGSAPIDSPGGDTSQLVARGSVSSRADQGAAGVSL